MKQEYLQGWSLLTMEAKTEHGKRQTSTKDKNAFMACLKLHRTRTGEIHYGVGGSVIRMSSWRRAGGFVFGYHLYNEDNEFCCACEKFGQHRIEMDSGICLHIGGGTTIDNLGEKRDALAHEDSLMYEMRHGFKP